MSDREESPEPQENGSPASDKSGSPSAAASHSPSPNPERKLSGSPQHHSRSRSHSYSRTYSRRHRSYSRSRSRSHSRRRHHRHYSRSHSRSPVERRYSRSRSRSYTSPRRSYSPRYYDDRDSHYHGGRKYYGGGGGGGYNNRYNNRSHNRSMSNRRHLGNRRTFVQDQDRQSSSHSRRTDNPSPSRCLGVFGLSLYTQEAELREVFAEYGHIKEVQVVYDAQSGRSRGFAFVYYDSEDDAKAAKDGCNGIEIDGRKIRVDFSITQRAHTPTPGIYMGKPSYSRGGGGSSSGSYRGGGGGGRRNSYRDRSPSPYYRRYSRSRSISPRKYGYY